MSKQRQSGGVDLGDYIDVAARIAEFRQRYPEGSLQPADPAVPYRIEQIGGDTYIVVVAAAYRGPDDGRPGIGMAYEVYPGRTPYTRGSELQNAETSAWGRAIVAALAADTKKGVASQEEVRNRRAEQEQTIRPPTEDQFRAADALRAAIETAETEAAVRGLQVRGALDSGEITWEQYQSLYELAKQRLVVLQAPAQGAS